MDIPDIRIKGGDIDIIQIPFTPDYLLEPPQALQVPVPITNQIGVPIVDIPGCVEAHEVDENNMLEADDPKGVKVYCDGQQPSFNPIDYNANDLKFSGEASVPPVKSPEPPEAKTPDIPKKTNTAEIKCPTEAQELKEPIGTLVDAGKKKIVEYRLVGKECIPIKEDLKIPDQIVKAIPSAGQVTTTAAVAVIATAAANIALMNQQNANKRLDFEIARLKNCGELLKSGIRFAPGTKYAKICEDVQVQGVNFMVPHTHKIK